MALILRCGETLEVNDQRYDESGRFKLILQADGNLVIYAHAVRPTPQVIPTDATNTGYGADVHLHLSDEGQLQIRRSSDPTKVMWKVPYSTPLQVPTHDPARVRWHPAGLPPIAGSTLHLQADGVLVLYGPDMTSEHARWAMGKTLEELSPENDPDASKFVAPGALVLEINTGVLSPSGSCVIRNDTPHTLEVVTPLQRAQQVAAGAFATIRATGVDDPVGTLSIPLFPGYDGPGTGSGISATKVRLPAGAVVSVVRHADGGFGLAEA